MKKQNTVTIRENAVKKGIELIFAEKPDDDKAAQPAKAKAKAEDKTIVQTGTVEVPITKYNEMVNAMKQVKELQKQLEAIRKALA